MVNAGAITTFGRHSIISENRLIQLPENISMREASLLGCAIPTGVGVVLNTAQAKAGQSMAIFGIGGIGLCAVGAANLSGCTPIIAIDIREDKLDHAKSYGATHCISSKGKDPVGEILQICPGGVDFAIEASGATAVVSHALRSVRNQGGTAVVVGNPRHGEQISLDPWQLNLGKRLLGTWGGDNVPDRDFPRYCKLLQVGKLKLNPYISKTYRLEELNNAIDDLETGYALRPLIDMKS
jgi:S-(hydroxymethyl)glutathione dehydrogenase/alcohol dehydrogenase